MLIISLVIYGKTGKVKLRSTTTPVYEA